MSVTTFFMLAFGALCVQMFIGLIQVREIRNALRNEAGSGIVGMGHNKTLIRPGRIVILLYDPKENRVITTKMMRGYTNFAKFKKYPEYDGMTLEEIRGHALEDDAKFFKRRRKKHPYSIDEPHKYKGALIQAIEQIDLKLKEEKARPRKTIKVIRKSESELLEP